jgi:hypothetical protein
MELLTTPSIEQRIYMLREHKVMLDKDLAEVYGVSTRVLNQAVKRNKEKFPLDFVFQLNETETKLWMSQFVTSKPSLRMGLRKRPYAFTEHGALMAANMLRSRRAVQMSVFVVRAFVRLRNLLATDKDLARKLEELEKKYDGHFKVVFEAIRKLMEKPAPPALQVKGFSPR